MHNISNFSLRKGFFPAAALTLLMCVNTVSAQDFDDIYYNPNKKENKQENKTVRPEITGRSAATDSPSGNNITYVTNPDYASADTYNFNTGMLRDVDEYNRRTPVLNDSIQGDSILSEDDNFLYTRRIERFHNPDIVVNTGDEDLINYYYETQPSSPSVVNIYVDSDPYWAWGRPYYYSSWSWNPYYAPYWGPSFTLGWYDPWYSWSWNWWPSYSWTWRPGPSWGWGGGWHPGHPGGHHPGGWAGNWRPNPTSPGASRPHNWASGAASSRPGTNNPGGIQQSIRPGTNMGRISGSNASSIRPGSTRGSYSSATNANRWPANVNNPSVSGQRPGVSSINTSNSGATRGRNTSVSPSSGRTNNNSNVRPSSSSYNNNSSSYRSSSSSSSSRGSFGGGSNSRGSVGGGRSSGGGGRGRR